MDRTVSATCSKGLLPRVYVGGGASEESGTGFVDPLLLIGRRGGTSCGGRLSPFSYSTDVLRGEFALGEAPEAQASFGLIGGGMGLSLVAA